MLRWRMTLINFVVATVVLPGCATQTQTGAATGGALGAATGAIIGSQGGDAGPGALIGGAIGALGGGLIGAGLDENDAKNEARIAAATAPGPISTAEIVRMSQSGVGEEVIISTIQSSNAVFQLSPNDVISLHQQGVSNRVIQSMQQCSRRAPVVVRQPVVCEPVYVMPPPPPVIRFGVYGGRHRHCW